MYWDWSSLQVGLRALLSGSSRFQFEKRPSMKIECEIDYNVVFCLLVVYSFEDLLSCIEI